MSTGDPEPRVVVWLRGEVKTPPFSREARMEAGVLLRQLQDGVLIGMPHSRPMPSIGKRCHELRVTDRNRTWRIVYRLDGDAVLILEVFSKTTGRTPKHVIDGCQERLARYDAAARRPRGGRA